MKVEYKYFYILLNNQPLLIPNNKNLSYEMNKSFKFSMLLSLVTLSLLSGSLFSQEEANSLIDENGNTVTVESAIEVRNLDISPEIFQNLTVKAKEEAVSISWHVDYAAYEQLQGKQLIVKYITDIGAKREKKGLSAEWLYSEPIDISETSITISELSAEKYNFKLGIAKEGKISEVKQDDSKMVWSKKLKTKPLRGWGIFKLLVLIGSLGFFIYGMKVMSEGLQKAAGNRLRQMLGAITSNRWKGVLSGFGITSIVQSSSVTTVMTVSFVNAGLMTLRQSAGVMMGANIGTTITAWLVVLLGFKLSINSYALVIIAFAAPLLFMRSNKAKAWAMALFGFSILFIGLGYLKDAVPSLGADSQIVQFFNNYSDVWYGPIMFVFLGALVTIVIQSSSAAMALTLTMVHNGLIPFEVACAMVLGENIGTTITAEIASMIANVHAKRSARIHSIFNLVGVTWMLLLFPFALKGLTAALGWWQGEPFDPSNKAMAESGIALFHTAFNLVNVLLLIWFVPQLVSLAIKSVKSKGDEDEQFRLEYISGAIQTPELSVLEAKKEVAKFGKLTKKMSKIAFDLGLAQDTTTRNKLHNKIAKYEEITDRLEVEISNFLSKVSASEMSENLSNEIRGLLSMTNDLERIGDVFYQISKSIERRNDNKLEFNVKQTDSISQMYKVLDNSFEIMVDNLNAEGGGVQLQKAVDAEREINTFRNQLRKKHISSIGKEGYDAESGMIYSNLFSSLERIGDHIINVSEAAAGEV